MEATREGRGNLGELVTSAKGKELKRPDSLSWFLLTFFLVLMAGQIALLGSKAGYCINLKSLIPQTCQVSQNPAKTICTLKVSPSGVVTCE